MLEARPPLDDTVLEAVRAALQLEDGGHPAYAGAWRRTAIDEGADACDERVEEDGYALSPRRTRGATRA